MERRDCMLQMDELYFSSFDFEQSREDSNTEYDVSFHIEYAKNKKDSAKFRVMIRTAVENKTAASAYGWIPSAFLRSKILSLIGT